MMNAAAAFIADDSRGRHYELMRYADEAADGDAVQLGLLSEPLLMKADIEIMTLKAERLRVTLIDIRMRMIRPATMTP